MVLASRVSSETVWRVLSEPMPVWLAPETFFSMGEEASPRMRAPLMLSPSLATEKAPANPSWLTVSAFAMAWLPSASAPYRFWTV